MGDGQPQRAPPRSDLLKTCMRLLAQTLFAAVLASLVGDVSLLTAQEIEVNPKVRTHQEHSPAQRKIPHRLSEQTKYPNGLSKPWWDWEHATGDWGGLRPWLNEHGAIVELTYTGEVFSSLRGGIDTDDATEYRGNVDLTVTLDTERLGLWPEGTLFVYLQNGHGRGLTDDHVDDVQTLSNIDANAFTQISEYWIEQRLFENRLRIKLGKQDTNADFCALDYGGDFINSSFGVIPTVPLPTFPDPALGIAAILAPTDSIALGLGVYDGASNGRTSGFDTTFDGDGGTFGIAELVLRTSLWDEAWRAGTYRLGIWYHSDEFEEITATPEPESFAGNHGIYLAFDQRLHKEQADPQDQQGIGAFAQFGWTPADRNPLTLYVGGGVTYTGALADRDQDVLGVGVAHARFSDRVKRLEGRTHETAVETFYRAQITPWLVVQPDLQFVANPGGDGNDAFIAGLRFAIDF